MLEHNYCLIRGTKFKRVILVCLRLCEWAHNNAGFARGYRNKYCKPFQTFNRLKWTKVQTYSLSPIHRTRKKTVGLEQITLRQILKSITQNIQHGCFRVKNLRANIENIENSILKISNPKICQKSAYVNLIFGREIEFRSLFLTFELPHAEISRLLWEWGQHPQHLQIH